LASYAATIDVRVTGLPSLKNLENRIGLLQQNFTKLNAAAANIAAPFAQHIQAINQMNVGLRESTRLLEQQLRLTNVIVSRTARGGAGGGGGGTNSNVLEEQRRGWQQQILQLQQRARLLTENTAITDKLRSATESLLTGTGQTVRLGLEQLKNAKALLTAAEDRAKTEALNFEHQLELIAEVEKEEEQNARNTTRRIKQEQDDRNALLKQRMRAIQQIEKDEERAGRAQDKAFFGGARKGGNRLADALTFGNGSKAVSGAMNAAVRGGVGAAVLAEATSRVTAPDTFGLMRGLGIAAPSGQGVSGLFGGVGKLAASMGLPGAKEIDAVTQAVNSLLSSLANMPGALQLAAVAAFAFAPAIGGIATQAVVKGIPALGKLGKALADVTGLSKTAAPAIEGVKNVFSKGGASFMEPLTDSVSGMNMELNVTNNLVKVLGATLEENLAASKISRLASGFKEFSAGIEGAIGVEKAKRRNLDKRMRGYTPGTDAATQLMLPAFQERGLQELSTSNINQVAGQTKTTLGQMSAIIKPMTADVSAMALSMGNVKDNTLDVLGVMRQLGLAIEQLQVASNKADMLVGKSTGTRQGPIEARTKALQDFAILEKKLISEAAALRDTKDLNSYNTRQKRIKYLADLENKASEERRKVVENVALGAAFPLLFGGGAGAVLGGAAGGFVPGNPMMSVVTSSLGTQLDTIIQSAVDFSKSMRAGGDAAGYLEEKLGYLDPAVKKQIQNLQSSGQTAEAAKVAFNKLASEVGKDGAAAFLQAGKNAEGLQSTFTKLTLSIIAAGFAFNQWVESQKAFKFDPNTLPGPFRPTAVKESETTTSAYKQKTTELQNQNTLLGLQATLKGVDNKKDVDSYAILRRKVAQQEYENELLSIKVQLAERTIGLDQNQLLIRKANLELTGKLKDIELDRSQQMTQNAEQAAQQARQAADKEAGIIKSVASLRKETLSTVLEGVNAQYELDTLYKGEYAVLKDRIKNAQNELDLKTLILNKEEEAALASADDSREQAALVKLYDQKYKLLQLQASTQDLLNKNKAIELQYAKDIATIQNRGAIKVAGSKAAADIAGARGNLARSLGGTGFEFQQQQLNAQQQSERDALATRLEAINRLEADIPNLKGDNLEKAQKTLTTDKAQYAIDLQRLDTLSAIEQQQLRVNQVTEQYGGIANSIGNAFSTSFKGIINGTMTAQEALAGFFQSVADAFLDMAAQIIAKWIQMTILNSILSLFPGGGLAKSGGSGFDMGGINNTGLGTFNRANSFPGLGRRAMGGPVAGGTPYIVGEKGPELFMPGRSGTVIPNNALGGGSTNVVVNVDASGNSNVQGDQAQAKQLGVVVSAAVQAELVKQQRPGGLLAGTRR
jgi:hypothetical protein